MTHAKRAPSPGRTGWSPEEIARLRQLRAEGRPLRAIAALLGRGYPSVKCAAQAHTDPPPGGSTAYRRWSAGDDALLRRLYGQEGRTAEECAAALGRGLAVTAVFGRVKRLKLMRRPCFRRTPAAEARLRALNAEGCSDGEVADDLGCDRHALTAWRKELGLPCNARSQRVRAKVAAGVRRQLARLGAASLAELRTRRFRDFVVASGWPDWVPLRAAMMLNALAAKGPMTLRQLCLAVGVRWRGPRLTHGLLDNARKTTYLGALQKAGLVVRLGRVKEGGAGRCGVALYALGAEALRTLEGRARERDRQAGDREPAPAGVGRAPAGP